MISSSLVLCSGLVSEEASGKHGGRCDFGVALTTTWLPLS